MIFLLCWDYSLWPGPVFRLCIGQSLRHNVIWPCCHPRSSHFQLFTLPEIFVLSTRRQNWNARTPGERDNEISGGGRRPRPNDRWRNKNTHFVSHTRASNIPRTNISYHTHEVYHTCRSIPALTIPYHFKRQALEVLEGRLFKLLFLSDSQTKTTFTETSLQAC